MTTPKDKRPETVACYRLIGPNNRSCPLKQDFSIGAFRDGFKETSTKSRSIILPSSDGHQCAMTIVAVGPDALWMICGRILSLDQAETADGFFNIHRGQKVRLIVMIISTKAHAD
jgi:hypothetical protein